MAGRKPTISDEEILQEFVEASDPFLSTTEIGEVLEFSQPGILKRLRSLEDDGLVRSKKAGNSNVWWLTDSGREFLEED